MVLEHQWNAVRVARRLEVDLVRNVLDFEVQVTADALCEPRHQAEARLSPRSISRNTSTRRRSAG